ncbi:hypothetical protein EDB92DRAFT_1829121 [Lactarius akahatsu]|uniref:Uncharacterized protein n=1 Tax=Lactarius akahatsu TaxID=416441 RepID=A0AAD4QF02_9AGAM|nr:hypothetical protein EDB92DRAFT_1829121 [Lactarius akahatsu]
MKSTLILTATSLLAAVAAVHGGVIEVSSGATGSTQNPTGTASVSSSTSYASSTPGSTPTMSQSISTGTPSGTPSVISSSLPSGTPLASTFKPETTYIAGN